MADNIPPPIIGDKPMSQATADLINIVRASETTVLQIIQNLADDADVDLYWLSVGRTDIQKGFMSVCRSIVRTGG